MGFRDRIKRRLKGARSMINRVHEEAQYPGRPQPHMAARNPMWGGAEDKPPEGTQTRTTVPPPAPDNVDPYATNHVAPEAEGDYWFLKDSAVEDGWRATNPGKTKAPPEDDGDT